MSAHQAGKRAHKHNAVQKRILIEYMQTHGEFAAGRFVGARGKEKCEQLWNELSIELNSHGTEKATVQWQKVWKDIKARVKTKAVGIKMARLKTGNFPINNDPFTEEDRVILGLVGSAATEGCMVPDSMPEEMSAITELREASEAVLEKAPTDISIFENYGIFTPNDTIDMEIETGEGNIFAKKPEIAVPEFVSHPGTSSENFCQENASAGEKSVGQTASKEKRPSFRLRQKRTRRNGNDETINRILAMQEKQNEILDKMAQAMLMTSKNEERRLRLEEEKLEVKKQTCQALNAIAHAMTGHI